MRIGVLFSGQGSQLKNMGNDFIAKDPGLAKYFNIVSEMVGENILDIDEKNLKRTVYTQPTLFAFQCMVWDYFKRMSSNSNVVYGMSSGLLSSMYASGVLNYNNSAKIIIERARLMNHCCERNRGGMVAVFCNDFELIQYICLNIFNNKLQIANYNSYSQLVVSGDIESLLRMEEILGALGIGYRKLIVSGAFHSNYMKTASCELKKFMNSKDFKFQKGNELIMLDNGEFKKDSQNWNDYVSNQLVKPTNYLKVLLSMKKSGIKDFVEISPTNVLSKLGQSVISDGNFYEVSTIQEIRSTVNELSKS